MIMENREIKFRFWNNNDRTMSKVKALFIDYHALALHGGKHGEHSAKMIDGVLEQYTGLKDKNGEEIYEGDVVKMHRFTQVLGENLGVSEGEVETTVTISMGVMGVMVNDEPLFAYFDDTFNDMSEPFEVIGNIHENPELL